MVVNVRGVACRRNCFCSINMQICNGNRTEWSPMRSVIIRVITKSDDRAVESDLFIKSMITDRISEKTKISQVM